MKFTLKRVDLERALVGVKQAVGKNPALLTCVRFVAGERLQVDASNLDLAISWSVDAQVASPGNIAIPARPLRELVEANDGDQFSLESRGDRVVVNIGKTSGSLAAINAADWPTQPSVVTGESTALDKRDVERLASVARGAIPDQARGALSGVRLSGRLAMATDGYRIAVAHLSSVMPDALIPAGLVRSIVAVGQTDWRVSADSGRVSLTSAESVWTSPTLAGQFPDCVALVQSASGGQSVEFDRREMLAVLRRVAVFPGTSRVRLQPTVNGIELFCEDVDSGLTRETVSSTGSLAFPLAFRDEFFADGLRATEGDTVRMFFSAPSKPIVLSGGGVEYLIHPIKEAS